MSGVGFSRRIVIRIHYGMFVSTGGIHNKFPAYDVLLPWNIFLERGVSHNPAVQILVRDLLWLLLEIREVEKVMVKVTFLEETTEEVESVNMVMAELDTEVLEK